MRISLIVAMAQNRVIGRNGDLPWRIPGDLKYFKQTTLGKPVVMGRKTWDSLGRPLPGRPNIVITRDCEFVAQGAHVTHSLDQALEVARTQVKDAEIMIIGGAEIYRQALPLAGRIYMTEVHLKPEGDALFEDFDRAAWHEVSRREVAADGGVPAYSITVLDRNLV